MAGARPDLCQVIGVQGYPTWVVGGQRYEGVLSLPRLAELSRFLGWTPNAPAAR